MIELSGFGQAFCRKEVERLRYYINTEALHVELG